jgi:hypothetical protein
MSTLEFFAEENPSAARCEQLSALYPTNPLATVAYLKAEGHFSSGTWLLGCLDNEKLSYGCLAFLYAGRLDRRLMLPSLQAAEETFWSGLRSFCSRNRITVLELNTYVSPGVQLPSFGKELRRAPRFEFIVPLDDGSDPLDKMRTNHRQSVRKGIKAGLQMRVTSDTRYLEEHVRLIGSSLRRREARGEIASGEASEASLQPYVTSGFCVIFQAMLEQSVVSSMTVACSKLGGYLHTAGTAPVGMENGASHFLLYEILKATQARGATVFNMGGVGDQDSGLAKYKKHFGAYCVPLEAADFYVGNALNRLLSTSAGSAKNILRRLRPGSNI